MRMRRPGPFATQRTQMDDAATAGPQHRQTLLRYQKRSADVGREHVVPLFFGELIERNSLEEAGIVHHDVNAAHRFDRSLHRGGNALPAADVTGNGQRTRAQLRELRQGLLGLFV